ncbi:MAG TPA: PA14 domain-containing protein [Chloroflexota bacterium]|nr:PA14 domain-containing protein [Chloroflexota bacterium]
MTANTYSVAKMQSESYNAGVERLTRFQRVGKMENPIKLRRRHMRGLVQGFAAVTLAVAAEGILYRWTVGQPVDVTLAIGLFAVAAVLIYLAVAPGPEVVPSVKSGEWRSPNWLTVREHVIWIAVATLFANLLALNLFARNWQLNLAWLLYVASVILVIVLGYMLDHPSERSLTFYRPRFELVALAVVMLVALFFRAYAINILPQGLWFDEAQQGLAAERILSDPGFRPIWLTGISPTAALRLYWEALSFLIFGPSIFSIRILSITIGLVGVFGAYLLARELFGWRVGLAAAALLAVSPWHVNFSRMNLDGIWAVTYDALAVYFLVKALRTQRYFNYVLAGVFLGLAANSYYTSYFLAIVIALYLLFRLVTEGAAFLKASLTGLALFTLALLITASPLIQFAILHPSEYGSRIGQVSILGEAQRTHNFQPLEQNVVKHVLMFNYQGDSNGRHNLSSWPELDPISGGLFVLGLVISLRFWRRSNFMLLLLAIVILLSGGILSVDFEAPQSLRTIDDSLYAAILAALPIGFLWTRLAELGLGVVRVPIGKLGVARFTIGSLASIVLLAVVTRMDYIRYFEIQAQDNASWAAFSIGPTLLAETMKRLGDDYDVYMSPTFIGQPSIQFLDPQIKVENPFNPAVSLPLRDTRNVAIFLDVPDAESVDLIRRLYPSASVQTFQVNRKSPIDMYSVIIPETQIEALEGLNAIYYAGQSATPANARLRRIDRTIDNDWSKQAPLPIPFLANWQGVILAPEFGTYRFKFNAPPDASVRLDQNDLLKGGGETSIELAQGLHSIEVNAPMTDRGPVSLLWQPPGQLLAPVPSTDLFHPPADNRGLLGKYYAGTNWSGTPRLEQINPIISSYYHFLPIPQPFTVEWDGKIDIPTTGLYRFSSQSIDASWIYLDNRLIVDNSHASNGYVEGAVNLTEGLHDIKIRYLSKSGFPHIDVSWAPPGSSTAPLPGDRLFPPQGAYPERAGPLRVPPPAIPTTPMAPPPPPPLQLGGTKIAPSAGALPASPLTLKTRVGQAGDGPGQLKGPRGVAVDSVGNIFAIDTENKRVEEFSPDGKFLQTIGGPGEGNGKFQEPVSAVVNPAGELVVLDATTGWIQRFSAEGKFLGQFAGPQIGFYHPRAIAVDPAGNYFVADTGTGHVVEFDPTGNLVKRLGDQAKDQEKPPQPVGVAVDSQDTLYVTDTGNTWMTHYDASYQVLQRWAVAPFNSLKGDQVALGIDGTVYVSDPGNQRVVHYSGQGKPLDQIGAPGQLSEPVGIAVGPNGQVYVADATQNQILVFGQ